MSIDANAAIKYAIDQAQIRRAAATGVTDAVFNADGVTKAAERVTELSVEDLAGAMKTRNAKKQDENQFIQDNRLSFLKRKDNEDDEASNPIHAVARNFENKINSIQNNAVKAIDRQNNIAGSLKTIQKDPFVK